MSKIVQCIPNFSEGRRPEVVQQIAVAAESGGCKVIDYSLDADHNRSVVTLLGDPDSVHKSVLAAVRTACEHIDMRSHRGAHPRIGAADVIPLVPIRDATMQECVELSRTVGRSLAEDLSIPVYFYAESAVIGHRRNLANVRRGGYEALAHGPLRGQRAPDVGPNTVHPTAGATVVGARGPLIAFNVDLHTNDIGLARRISSAIRTLRDEGRGMAGVRSLAVDLASRAIVQVSTNITEPQKTSMFEVYEFVKSEAEKAGVEVERSELIGVVRLDALARAASESLQLSDFGESRVLDYWIDRD